MKREHCGKKLNVQTKHMHTILYGHLSSYPLSFSVISLDFPRIIWCVYNTSRNMYYNLCQLDQSTLIHTHAHTHINYSFYVYLHLYACELWMSSMCNHIIIFSNLRCYIRVHTLHLFTRFCTLKTFEFISAMTLVREEKNQTNGIVARISKMVSLCLHIHLFTLPTATIP